MSSEQRYDLPFEQLGEDSTPSLDFFADFLESSTTEVSPFEFEEQSLTTGSLQSTLSSPFDMTAFDWDPLQGNGILDLPHFTSTLGINSLDSGFFQGSEQINAGSFSNHVFETLIDPAALRESDSSSFHSHQAQGTANLTKSDSDFIRANGGVQKFGLSCLDESAAFDFDYAQSKWTGPSKCDRRGCVSKAVFHSPSALKAHLKNVHVSPLICTKPGCKYKKPFGKPSDLKRHLATVHNAGDKLECLEIDCHETFFRKDKMLKHAREKHERYRCGLNHCTATVFAAERKLHTQNAHGKLECDVGACKNGKRSFFSRENLERHLRTAHSITFWPTQTIIERASGTLSDFRRIARLHPVNGGLKPTWLDCKLCSAEQEHLE